MKGTAIMVLFGLLLTVCCGKTERQAKKVTLIVQPDIGCSLVECIDPFMSYYLYLPPSAGKRDSNKQWPLLMYLHGLGMVSNDLNSAIVTRSPLLQQNVEIDFSDSEQISSLFLKLNPLLAQSIILFPQSKMSEWQVDVLFKKIAEICETYSVDQDRIYMTGVSMGGIGTWLFAVTYPGILAAVVPVCGVMNHEEEGVKIRDVATWAFHAADDTDIVPSASYFSFMDGLTASDTDHLVSILGIAELPPVSMAAGIDEYKKLKNGESVLTLKHIFTFYGTGGHIIWDSAYGTSGLWDWVFAQKRINNE